MFPAWKTKIVCTIGPASETEEVIARLLEAGMNIARLNLSHGDPDYHARLIERLRQVASRLERRLAIMADLPGPKMRLGKLLKEPLFLRPGEEIILTARTKVERENELPLDFPELPHLVQPGETIFLNDGLVELRVERVEGIDIFGTVIVGGEVRSRKGINVPGIKYELGALTKKDEELLRFILKQGVEAVSLSFVGSARDLLRAREIAREQEKKPFLIAKIERAAALERLDEIIAAADGIMVARGDLGVEIPIERIALVQKDIVRRANILGKPVIIATQMLQSMTHHRRPTRAEATDVANAILDGADALMLSDETATGRFPVEAVEMLAKIAQVTEPHLDHFRFRRQVAKSGAKHPLDLLSLSVDDVVDRLETAAVFCLTEKGHTPRAITRFRLPCWIVALSSQEKTCQELLFSFGVWPQKIPPEKSPWEEIKRLHTSQEDKAIIFVSHASEEKRRTYRLEILPDKEFH